MNSNDSNIVHAAVDGLLAVVARSADDLRAFHDALAKARRDDVPFPRVAVATSESIIDHLKIVEEKLQEVMVALGLSSRKTPDAR